MQAERWGRGERVVWRSVQPPGRVRYAIPGYAVADGDGWSAFFQPSMTVCMRTDGPRGGPRGVSLLTWNGHYRPRQWTGPGTLRLHPAGGEWSVIRHWDVTTDSYQGWYINLEADWRRTPIGFDSRDHILDITVADDLTSWAWKDRDTFTWAQHTGRLTAEDAASIEAAGRHAIETLRSRQWPFDADWRQWRPDTAWQPYLLPPTFAAAEQAS